MLCMKTSSLVSRSLSKDGNVIRCIQRETEALLLFRQGVANEYDHLGSWNSTRVSISHSLCDLPYLTYLDPSSNHLAEIPNSIGSIKKLVRLIFLTLG